MFGRDQQVGVVGHEYVGMQGASLLVQCFSQPVEIGMVVFFAKETGFPVMSALHDVQGYAIKVNPRTAGHMHNYSRKIEPGPFCDVITTITFVPITLTARSDIY